VSGAGATGCSNGSWQGSAGKGSAAWP